MPRPVYRRERILCRADGALYWEEGDPDVVPPQHLTRTWGTTHILFVYDTTYVEEDIHGRVLAQDWYHEWEGD